jgi:hypothetical protein
MFRHASRFSFFFYLFIELNPSLIHKFSRSINVATMESPSINYRGCQKVEVLFGSAGLNFSPVILNV